MNRTGEIRLHDTSVSAWDEDVDEDAMLMVLRGTMSRLRFHGFKVGRDPHTATHYPTLAKSHYYGRKGDLEFNAEQSGRMCKIEFYQNVANVDNPNGGRYCFGKFARMPRPMRIQCAVAILRTIQKFMDLGYTFDARGLALPGEPFAMTVLGMLDGRNLHGDMLADFNGRWTAERFRRDERGWPTEAEYGRGTCGRNVDRDKKPIRCGDVKHVRRNGRLFRGTAFTNMNDMWGVFSNGQATWVHCSELFDCERPDLEPRRVVQNQPGRIRKELDRALKAEDFGRVAVLANVLKGAA